jgi:thiol-disulfide isomerase/thioredoxin
MIGVHFGQLEHALTRRLRNASFVALFGVSVLSVAGCATGGYRLRLANEAGDRPQSPGGRGDIDDLDSIEGRRNGFGRRRDRRLADRVDGFDDRLPQATEIGPIDGVPIRSVPAYADESNLDDARIARGVIEPEPGYSLDDRRATVDPADDSNRSGGSPFPLSRNGAVGPPGERGTIQEELANGPEIRGQVVDSFGQPASEAAITVRETVPPSRVVSDVVADRNGQFRIVNLEPGRQYLLSAGRRDPDGRLSGSAVVTVPDTNVMIQMRDDPTGAGFGAEESALDRSRIGSRDDDTRRRRSNDRNMLGLNPSRLRRDAPSIRTVVPEGSTDGSTAIGSLDPRDGSKSRDFRDRLISPRETIRPERDDDALASENDRRGLAGRVLDAESRRNRDRLGSDRSTLELVGELRSDFDLPPSTKRSELPVPESADRSREGLTATDRRMFAGSPLERMTVTTLSGDRRELGDIKGDLALIDFWGSWCGPCRRAVPAINELDRKYGDRGLSVLGVACERESGDDGVDEAGSAVEDLKIRYSVAVEDLNRVSPLRRHFDVKSFPTLVLVDRRGNLLAKEVGADPSSMRKIESAIQSALSRMGR